MTLKKLMLPAFVIAMVVSSCNAQEKPNTNMKTEKDSISYSLGVSIANNLKQGNLDDVNVDIMAQGMKDFFANKPAMTVQACEGAIQTYMSGKEKEKGAANEAKGKAFLEENKKKEGIVTTASGLQYKVVKMGTGVKPTLNDKITAHYHGTLIDGTVFDSSVDRGEPASFPVTGVIPGWTEALQLMPVGSKWMLYLPSNLAYGERGAGGKIGPNTALIFEVELISIDK
jgi:FKBP-type peptidyl-prolyl cis-trans isomerase FklB